MEIFVALLTIFVITPFLLPYVIPYVRRYHKPVPPPSMTKVLALDPDMFKAKREAIKNEHRVWGEEFKRNAGHTWDYKPITVEPEIRDEAADETILAYDCENHNKNEVCHLCDGVETVRNWQGQMIYQKRQRRKR